MPCATCGHTLANLGVPVVRVFYCDRCGTIMVERAGAPEDIVCVPKLVERVRELLKHERGTFEWSVWPKLRNLAESVGEQFPPGRPSPTTDTIDGKIELCDLKDPVQRLMLADALEEVGRSDEAEICREGHPDLSKWKASGGWQLAEIPF